VSNNLGGLGPTTGPQEVRFKRAASSNGKYVDVVIKATNTQDKYHSFTPKEHNIITARGFQINLGVTAKQGKPVTTTEFEFSFEDQQGYPVEMDAVDIYLTDLDRDAKVTLREQGCYNLDELDLKSSSIPGFDTNTLKLKPEPVHPGFSGTQLRTTYNKDKNCDGSSQTNLGSVTVEANQVGFECDNSLDTPMKDFKPIKCTDPGCFTDKACQKKRKYFGLIDKDGKTCTKGAAGCTFQAGIRPLTRLVKTRYISRSSFRISLGIECLKPAGQTCTRNFAFRPDYQNKKNCPCRETEQKGFHLHKNLLTVNNLGGLGPQKDLAKELRYKYAGMTVDR
jgi:hypothetical protein